MLDDNYGMYGMYSSAAYPPQDQLSNNVSNEYVITTTTDNTNMPSGGNYGKLVINSPHAHNIDPQNWLHQQMTYAPNYEELFVKLITYILGASKVSQDIKDEFINQEMRLKEFRDYVKEYFPQYIDKITLWEKLHPGEK